MMLMPMPPPNLSFVWKPGQSPEDIWSPAFDKWLLAIYTTMQRIMDEIVPQVITWMRENAAWEDITGDARAQLGADVHVTATSVSMNVFHGVDYGIWLEIAHEGRYAILGRTVDYWGVQFWTRVNQVMS